MNFDFSVDQISIVFDQSNQNKSFMREEILIPKLTNVQFWFGLVYFLICSNKKIINYEMIEKAFERIVGGFPILKEPAEGILMSEMKRKFFDKEGKSHSRLSLLFWGVSRFVLEVVKWQKRGCKMQQLDTKFEI